MRLRRAAVAVALGAMVVAAGCGRGGDGDGDGAGGAAQGAPAADEVGARDQAAPAGAPSEAGKAGGSTRAAAEVRLVDLGNRVVRTALVDLEVDEGGLNEAINDATDVVLKARGLYVGSSTSAPEGEPASGQVTFRVPVDAFEPVLRQLKELGT